MNTRWQPGQSGNPTGRRVGTQNRVTATARKLLEENAADVLKTTIEAAKSGDMIAARLVIGLIYPKKIRPAISIPSLQTPKGIAEALAVVATEAANGTLEADEVRALTSTIEAAGRQIDLNQHLYQFLGAVMKVISSESPDTAKRITEHLAKLELEAPSPENSLLLAGMENE